MSPKSGAVRNDVLLVGSLPFDTAEEAFRAAAEGLRGHVGWLPDGEVAERVNWVGMLPLVVFPTMPELEETLAPAGELEQPDRDAERQPVEDLEGIWSWRVRPGQSVRFDDLAYGRFARESYEVFHRLEQEGVIPQGVRFQVSLPAPHSAIDGFFDDASQWPDVYAAYLDGIRREIASILEVVPADKLVIQWDAAWEFVDMAMAERNFFKFWPRLTAEQKFQRHAEQLDGLWQGIPDETLLGYHWCYGTWGGWPMTAMSDLGLCVRMSNEARSAPVGASTTSTCPSSAGPTTPSSRRSTTSTSATPRSSSASSTTRTASTTSAADGTSPASTSRASGSPASAAMAASSLRCSPRFCASTPRTPRSYEVRPRPAGLRCRRLVLPPVRRRC